MPSYGYLDSPINPLTEGAFAGVVTGLLDLLLADASNEDLTLGKLVRVFEITGFAADDVVTGLRWQNNSGKTFARLDGLSITNAGLEAGLGLGTANEGNNEVSYEFLVSLLNGRLTVTGSEHDDTDMEVGEGGKATVDGKGGNDHLFVWHQKKVDYDGGKGRDTIEFGWNIGFYAAPTSGAVVNLKAGTGTNPWGGALTFAHVENVIGVFDQDNNLRGNDASNYLQGGTKADVLRGEGGNDSIDVKYGSAPRGTIADGGTGKDTLTAELSTFDFVGAGPGIIFINVLDLEKAAKNRGTFAGGTFENFEIIKASAGTQYERFDFRGDADGQTAIGSLGKDILDGRKGNDRLTGFGAEDQFVFSTTLNAETNVDTVTDFVHDVDTIVLKGSLFTAVGASLDPSEFRNGSGAKDGDDHIIYRQSSGELSYDKDGKGGAGQVLFAILASKPALDSGDFAIT